MVYITKYASKRHHQMSFEEFMMEDNDDKVRVFSNDPTNTTTRTTDRIRIVNPYLIERYTKTLSDFNGRWNHLRAGDRSSLYRSFKIPKRSGGLRQIDAPNESLMIALRELKAIFERTFGMLYHTSAFAYVRGRSTLSAVKKHQENESRWFGKYDLSNFFGSTTLDFTMKMLSMIYPTSEIMKNENGRRELEKAVELAFLNGGLPQGTPLSPTLTNIIMIPIDYYLSNKLRDFDGNRFVYTRYADDFLISSRYDFDPKKVETLIVNTLSAFGAPFKLNTKKTRYGSSAGSNWNLGVMLNKDNEITIGAQRKREFKAMLHNYAMDVKSGRRWSLEDVQHMEGLRSYYRMVEKDKIDKIVSDLSIKTGVDILSEIKNDLRS